MAYSQDPDGVTAGNDYPVLAAAATQLPPTGAVVPLVAGDFDVDQSHADQSVEAGRKPFLLVGSVRCV